MRRSIIAAAFVCLNAAGGVCAQEIYEGPAGIYATDTLRAVLPSHRNADIDIKSAVNMSGSIVIRAADQDQISVAYVKKAKADSRSQAIDFIDLISVADYNKPTAATIELRAPNPAPWSGTDYRGWIDAVITVPTGSGLDIDAYYFDITASGPLKSVVVPSSLGRLDISHVTEKLEITTANRRVNLRDIAGSISATTSNSSLIAESIVSHDGQARFGNDGGDIRIDDFEGSLNAKNSYGRITIEGFRPSGESSFIRGSSAPIVIEIDSMMQGQLVVSNRNEDIDITVPDDIAAFFSLTVGEDGIIDASSFPFTTEMVQRNRLNLISGDGTVDISGSIRGEGNIYIRGSRGD